MNSFCAELGKIKNKPIALSLIPEYTETYVFKNHSVPAIMDFFDKKCLPLTCPELPGVLHES